MKSLRKYWNESKQRRNKKKEINVNKRKEREWERERQEIEGFQNRAFRVVQRQFDVAAGVCKPFPCVVWKG